MGFNGDIQKDGITTMNSVFGVLFRLLGVPVLGFVLKWGLFFPFLISAINNSTMPGTPKAIVCVALIIGWIWYTKWRIRIEREKKAAAKQRAKQRENTTEWQ
jgi:vacuolar-type H+-ATPase subunit I/STV1